MCDYLEGPNASIDARAFFEICMCLSLYCKASKRKPKAFEKFLHCQVSRSTKGVSFQSFITDTTSILCCNTFHILGFDTLYRLQLFYFCTIYQNTCSGLLVEAVPDYHIFFFNFYVAEETVL